MATEASETKSGGDDGATRGCACIELDAAICHGPTRGALHVAYGADPCPCGCHDGPSPDAPAHLPPPSPLEAAALAFCADIRPGGGLPSVADLCEAAATFRAARGGAP